MKELNQIIRQALYEIITIIEADETDESQLTLRYLVGLIPDYWEIPGEGRNIATS